MRFSWKRLWAMVVKEFTQMKRDKGTLGMMVGIPVLQLILFGYAINSDPKHLPTGVVLGENGIYTRAFLQGLKNSDYFDFVEVLESQQQADRALATGELQFVVNIPVGFERDLLKGTTPTILVEADATDPVATATAVGSLRAIGQRMLELERLPDSLGGASPAAFEVSIHARYNPEAIQRYNIVPGLIGVILTMTMTMITGLAITREKERGTMESLLATPATPLEVLLGKIAPYVMVGYVQVAIVLGLAWSVFGVPIVGNVLFFLSVCVWFIAANLAMGITFSTIAKNQLQAVQMTIFVFLPSILLSGFMFPFRGMPQWAQVIGEVLPNTHFIRIARGVLLKGNGLAESMGDLSAIVVFAVVVMFIAMKRYNQRLD